MRLDKIREEKQTLSDAFQQFMNVKKASGKAPITLKEYRRYAYAKTSSVTLQAELTEVHDPLNCINNNAITIPSGITKIRGHIKGTVTQATFSHGKFSVRKNGTEVYHADGKTLNPIAQYQVDENFYLDVAAGDVLTIFCVSEYSDPDKASTTLNSIDIDFIA